MELIHSRIKCFSCSKNLMPLRFSAVTQQRYRESLSRNQRDKRHEVFKPKCMNCTPGNVQEMKCHHCEKTMPLDRFAKAQRKTPDTAVSIFNVVLNYWLFQLCKDCQQDRVDREADFAKEVEENNIIEREKKQMVCTIKNALPRLTISRKVVQVNIHNQLPDLPWIHVFQSCLLIQMSDMRQRPIQALTGLMVILEFRSAVEVAQIQLQLSVDHEQVQNGTILLLEVWSQKLLARICLSSNVLYQEQLRRKPEIST